MTTSTRIRLAQTIPMLVVFLWLTSNIMAQTQEPIRKAIPEKDIQLPDYFGLYSVQNDGKIQSLKTYTADECLRLEQLKKEPDAISLAGDVEFIVYDKDIDLSLLKLIAMDRNSQEVKLLTKPVSNQSQMFRLIPTSNLPSGKYAMVRTRMMDATLALFRVGPQSLPTATKVTGATSALESRSTDMPTVAGVTPPVTTTDSNVVVIIETSLGTITAVLYPNKAPATVANFLAYTDDKFYDGTIFHRVIKDFMIQGGGFTTQMLQKQTKAPIKNEADNGLTNERGTLAMARTMAVDSATSQFFINDGSNNGFLNHTANTDRGYGYAVFGKVIGGMKVVDLIAGVPTGTFGNMENVPITPVEIKSISREVPTN